MKATYGFWNGQPIQDLLPLNYGNNLDYVGHTNGVKLGLTVIENLQIKLLSQPNIPSPPDYASYSLNRLHLHSADKNTLS